jgi:hypothetical protein
MPAASSSLPMRRLAITNAWRAAVQLIIPDVGFFWIPIVRRPLPRRGGQAILYRCPGCSEPAKPERALGEVARAIYPAHVVHPCPPYLCHCARLWTHVSTHCFSLPST